LFSYNFVDKKSFFCYYEESGLPQFDIEIRRNGTPWSRNIDDLLIDRFTGYISCVAKYQYFSKCSIREHDNNKYIHPSAY